MKKVINTILLAACFLFFLGNFTTNVLAEGINDKIEMALKAILASKMVNS